MVVVFFAILSICSFVEFGCLYQCKPHRKICLCYDTCIELDVKLRSLLSTHSLLVLFLTFVFEVIC